MKRLDRERFFEGYRTQFGLLKQDQVDGLTSLLDSLEAETEMTDLRWVAYCLATCFHETARTFRPIEEYGHGHGRKYGEPDRETGQTYFGRGYVQLTWKRNYQLFGDKLGIELTNNPSLALEPSTAYRIMSLGMREGLFTGKSLAQYIGDAGCDFLNARKIINGLDRATTIESYANRFLKILKGAQN